MHLYNNLYHSVLYIKSKIYGNIGFEDYNMIGLQKSGCLTFIPPYYSLTSFLISLTIVQPFLSADNISILPCSTFLLKTLQEKLIKIAWSMVFGVLCGRLCFYVFGFDFLFKFQIRFYYIHLLILLVYCIYADLHIARFLLFFYKMNYI